MGTVRCAAGRIASVAFSVALPTSCVASSSDERLLPALVVAGNASVAVPSLSVGEDDEGEYLDVVDDDELLLELGKLFEERLSDEYDIEE